jgi:hypothetical protein
MVSNSENDIQQEGFIDFGQILAPQKVSTSSKHLSDAQNAVFRA